MRIVGIFVLAVGVGMAGGSLYLANKTFSKYQNAKTETEVVKPQTVPVIVAGERIDYGAPIEESMIRVIDWPAASIPQGAFTSPEDLVGDLMQERRVALRPIEVGEAILESKVSGFGEDSRIAMMLSEGRRAYSLPIDAVSGVSGFISPGDRVDIMLTENADGRLQSRVILADTLVIAVDQQAQGNSGLTPRVGRTVTVDVSVRDAQVLDLAKTLGKLSFSLRGAGDVAREGETGAVVTVDDIRGVEREAPQEQERTVIRVRRGGAASEVEMEQ